MKAQETGAPSAPVSHQNVRLAKGRHGGPEEGACVVELASMLAGERFGDRPDAVCPVLAAYMRVVNDAVDAEQRQALLPYAAELVGTSGDGAYRARLDACARWSHRMGAISRLGGATLARLRRADTLGALCAKAALDGGLGQALVLADALIELSDGAAAPRTPSSRRGGSRSRSSRAGDGSRAPAAPHKPAS